MSRRYSCILIDDELLALAYLRTLCEEIPSINVVRAYNDPHRLLEELPNVQADFCISDIVMPVMNGLDLAKHLTDLPVIFTTAHNEYAADAFDIDAADYLRKPVKKQRLEKAVEKVIQLIQSREAQSRSVSITTSKGKMLLATDQVAFISAETPDRRDKLLTLRSGEEWVIKNTSFDQLLDLLPSAHFCRISRSEVIALNLVKGHTADSILSSITDKNGKERVFSLGENYRKAFLAKLKNL